MTATATEPRTRSDKEYGGVYPRNHADSVLIHPPGYARAGDVHFDDLSDDHWRIIIDELAAGRTVGFILCDNTWMGATIAVRVQHRCDFAIEAANDEPQGVLYLYRLDGPKPQAPPGCGDKYDADAVADALELCEILIDRGDGNVYYPNPTDLCVWLNNKGGDRDAIYEALMAVAPIVRRVWEAQHCETDDDETRPETTRTADQEGA